MSEDDKKACEDAVTDPEIAMPSLEDLEAARWAAGIVHPLGSALPDELPPGISGAKKTFCPPFSYSYMDLFAKTGSRQL